MKLAFAHDWLNGMRGGEKCLEALGELYPESPIYTLFHEKGKLSAAIERHPIRTTWLQRIPGVFRHYRWLLPLFPAAIESFRPEGYDVIVSSSHSVAKGIRKGGAFHLCYCHTPMRYAWSQFESYFGSEGPLSQWAKRGALERLKRWDLAANRGVDRFLANSKHVQKRIREFYGREAEVVYPPVDTAFYTPDASVKREDYYLIVSALVPYKRLDIALRAVSKAGRRLVVIGSGPDAARLRSIGAPAVEFLGWRSDEEIRDRYRRAKALLFPGEEDFGIVPVEAQACGLPVIALGKGGALETVLDGRTGVFFERADEESLAQALREFESRTWDPAAARANAERFGRERYKREMAAQIEAAAGAKAAA